MIRIELSYTPIQQSNQPVGKTGYDHCCFQVAQVCYRFLSYVQYFLAELAVFQGLEQLPTEQKKRKEI